jgi:molybdopterin converting factor small subunit
MALVCLHGPLRNLAGGRSTQEVAGDDVQSVLRGLEDLHPSVAGWILDERGTIRRHINVFVNGERGGENTAVDTGDRVEVLPAITGGSR